MTVSAANSIFGFACQNHKSDHGSYSAPTTWYRHHALRANVGPQQIVGQFPPEIGGGYHPTGAYKGGAFGAGLADVHPRLEEVIGWLLYAVVGSISGTATDTPEAGVNRHVFTPPADPATFKWMAIRSYTPGATAADAIGNEVLDARCVGMQLNLRAGQLVRSNFSFLGRQPRLQESTDLSSWTWDAACETYPSVPLVSAEGCSFSVGGTEQKATQAQITIANQFTTPQEEMIIGSPYPDDFIVRRQTLSFMWLYKWQDHDLYQSLVTGTNTASGGYIAWSPVPHSTTAEVVVVSPGNISGQTAPYRLRVCAPEVVWQTDGAPELLGDGWLQLRLTGQAQDQASGPTFQVDLDNEVASGGYDWPT